MFGARWLTLTALLLGLGCSDDCHDIGCGSSLIVDLAPDDGFEDGSYEVTLESPESTMVCTFEVAGGAVDTSSCDPSDGNIDSAELPASILVRYFQVQPSTLHVTVTRDGDELASEDLTPEYEEIIVDPNACGGPCTSAQVILGW